MTRRRHPLFCQGAAALSTKGSTSPVADGLRILTLALAAAPKLKAVAAATITKELTAKIDKAMLPDFLGPTQEEIDSYGPSL